MLHLTYIGLLSLFNRETKENREMPPFSDRLMLISHLERLGLKSGVELGVREGIFAAQVLKLWPSAQRYVLVDAWTQMYDAQYGKDDFNANFRTTMSQNVTRPSCQETFEKAMNGGSCGTKIDVCKSWTHTCADRFASKEFEFIYVDALHDYKGVLRDLEYWWPKLKPGGVIAGHDFLDMNSTYLNKADAIKVKGWRTNYDSTFEPDGKLVKGAVNDFFECKATVQNEKVVSLNTGCAHARKVGVATLTQPPRGCGKDPRCNGQDFYPPTWAVMK